MSRISITRDGAQVMGALLDRYYSAGHPCFKLGHEETCEMTAEKCNKCKHSKALQRLVVALYQVGASP